jgi:hypothetical protein
MARRRIRSASGQCHSSQKFRKACEVCTSTSSGSARNASLASLEPTQPHRLSATCGEIGTGNEGLVDQTSAGWNQITVWIQSLSRLRVALCR